MIKLIHTGDVHLGAKFEGFGEKGSAHRKQIEKTFEFAIDTAINKKADLFLIAGDLFDGDVPPQSVVDFARRQIEKLSKAGIKTVIIPGNHDFLSEKSVYKKIFWKEMAEVFVFNDSEITRRDFPDMDLSVFAKVLATKNSTESGILSPSVIPATSSAILNATEWSEGSPHQKDSLSLLSSAPQNDNNDRKYNIMLAHGSFIASDRAREMFFDQWPITADEIKNSKMDYIALGNFHGLQDISQGDVRAWYSGSPEPLAFDQKNAGSVLYVEIGENGVVVEPIKIGRRLFDQKEIILDNIADAGELKNRILEGADENLVRKIILSGFARPDIFIDEESLESELGESFFKLIIIDKSIPHWQESDEMKYPEEFVIGQFALLMKEKIAAAQSDIEKEIYQKALQLGLSELEK